MFLSLIAWRKHTDKMGPVFDVRNILLGSPWSPAPPHPRRRFASSLVCVAAFRLPDPLTTGWGRQHGVRLLRTSFASGSVLQHAAAAATAARVQEFEFSMGGAINLVPFYNVFPEAEAQGEIPTFLDDRARVMHASRERLARGRGERTLVSLQEKRRRCRRVTPLIKADVARGVFCPADCRFVSNPHFGNRLGNFFRPLSQPSPLPPATGAQGRGHTNFISSSVVCLESFSACRPGKSW